MAIVVPKIIQKYITVFPDEDSYDEAYPNFEEVNLSDVDYPEATPDAYRLSRRLSNMYHKNNPPKYMFDNINDTVTEGDKTYHADAKHEAKYRAADFDDGHIRNTYFLEIVWGYSGWEWKDYERIIGTDEETGEDITEVLKGGNLYKIKAIKTVPTIIDGKRLQHINDFLNSQNEVIKVSSFNTDNLIAINRAFKRVIQKNGYDAILECTLNLYNFPKVVEADHAFFNNKIIVVENNPINMPLLEEVDYLYSQGAYTNGLKFRMDNLKKMTNMFRSSYFKQSTINFNDILIGNTLKNINDFNGFLFMSSFYQEADEVETTISLDLTGSNVSQETIINLSKFASLVGTNDHNQNTGFTDRKLVINLDFNNLVDLSYGIAGALNADKLGPYKLLYDNSTTSGWYRNGAFKNIEFNINNKNNLVRSVKYFGAANTYNTIVPFTSRLNDNCLDDFIYYNAIFNIPVTYDFSPSTIINYSNGQFRGASLVNGFTFSHIDSLKSLDFRSARFPDNTIFPYVLNNASYTYNEDGSRHQNFSFANTNLKGFVVQDFYLKFGDRNDNSTVYDGNTSHYWYDLCNSAFSGMSNVDFTENHKLYIKSVNSTNYNYNKGDMTFDLTLFNGCFAMTETPDIYFTLDATDKVSNAIYFNMASMFTGCNNLVKVNMEHFEIIGTIDGSRLGTAIELVFTSPVLTHLKIGNINKGLRIYSEVLDIPTLAASLRRQTRHNLRTLSLKASVIEALRNYTADAADYGGKTVFEHCIEVYTQGVISF